MGSYKKFVNKKVVFKFTFFDCKKYHNHQVSVWISWHKYMNIHSSWFYLYRTHQIYPTPVKVEILRQIRKLYMYGSNNDLKMKLKNLKVMISNTWMNTWRHRKSALKLLRTSETAFERVFHLQKCKTKLITQIAFLTFQNNYIKWFTLDKTVENVES